jgi:hypothetical protein
MRLELRGHAFTNNIWSFVPFDLQTVGERQEASPNDEGNCVYVVVNRNESSSGTGMKYRSRN